MMSKYMDITRNSTDLEFLKGVAKGLSPWVAGITVTSSNPYWFLWWATAGAGALILTYRVAKS